MRHPHTLLLASLSIGFVACGPSAGGGGGGDGPDADPGQVTTCTPGQNTCAGTTVHSCNDDGTVGGLVETCPSGCSGGACVTDCGVAGNDKIFVVTSDDKLLLFDPLMLPASGSADAAFTLIGNLSCPATQNWPDYMDNGDHTAHPFSMSVDRDGSAWVLYSSGEIFKVSISDARCAPTNFNKGQRGFQLFGMGFVADAAGSSSETLYIAGGSAAQDTVGDLGKVDGTMAVSDVAALPSSLVGPELTGTAKAELYGYFPFPDVGVNAFVAKLDPATAQIQQQYDMDQLPGDPAAWAFAQYGGKFYVFISYQDPDTSVIVPGVKVVDPATPGTITTYDSNNEIVGAGVSTCAPAGNPD